MRAYPAIRNYVVSRTLSAADYPEVTILKDAVAVGPNSARWRARTSGYAEEGAALASLLAARLVDTIEFGISPRLLGGPGIPDARTRPETSTSCATGTHASPRAAERIAGVDRQSAKRGRPDLGEAWQARSKGTPDCARLDPRRAYTSRLRGSDSWPASHSSRRAMRSAFARRATADSLREKNRAEAGRLICEGETHGFETTCSKGIPERRRRVGRWFHPGSRRTRDRPGTSIASIPTDDQGRQAMVRSPTAIAPSM